VTGLRRFAAALPFVFALAYPAGAQGAQRCTELGSGSTLIGRTNGLSAPFSQSDFNAISAASGSALTGPLQIGGVAAEITGGYLGRAIDLTYSSAFDTNALYNFNEFGNSNALLAIDFLGAPVRGLAFNFILGFGEATITAWSGGTRVAQICASKAIVDENGRGAFWGFQLAGLTMNRVTILAPGFSSIGIDNLQVAASTVVPEPSTIGLLAFGLIGVGVAARRKAKAR